MSARGILAVGLAVAIVSAGARSSVFAAGITVPAGRLGLTLKAASAVQFKPAGCTGTVNSIVVVPSGGATFTVRTGNNLILGTSGNDHVTVTPLGAYECFVGGGPVASNTDKFAGSLGGGDQCVVAKTDTGLLNITSCTVVTRSP